MANTRRAWTPAAEFRDPAGLAALRRFDLPPEYRRDFRIVPVRPADQL